jgi:hypothetical protein
VRQISQHLAQGIFALAVAAWLDGVFATDHHHVMASCGARSDVVGLVAAV